MAFAASYREDTPVKVAFGSLALLGLSVALTFLAQILRIGSPQSLLDRLLRLFGTEPQTIGMAIVWTLAGAALLILAYAVALIRDETPRVQVDGKGLWDRRWSDQPVDWLNIAEFDIVRRHHVELVSVRLKDPTQSLPRTVLGKLARRAKLAEPDEVLILVPGLDCSAEHLCTKILEIGTAAVHAAEEAAEKAAVPAVNPSANPAGGAAMQNN